MCGEGGVEGFEEGGDGCDDGIDLSGCGLFYCFLWSGKEEQSVR